MHHPALLHCLLMLMLLPCPPSCRGGTWLFKAPEQLSSPGWFGAADDDAAAAAQQAEPYVCDATDVWSLGALICSLAHNGVLRSTSGLPFTVPPDQVGCRLQYDYLLCVPHLLPSIFHTTDTLLPDSQMQYELVCITTLLH
jgi:serine/threonine protein kinase